MCQRSSLAIFQEYHSAISPADSENGVFLSGSDGNHIEDVLFEDVKVKIHFKDANGQRGCMI